MNKARVSVLFHLPFWHICNNSIHPPTPSESRLLVRRADCKLRHHGSNLFLIHTNIHYTSATRRALLYQCSLAFFATAIIPFVFISPFFGLLSLDRDYHDVQTTKSMPSRRTKRKIQLLTSCSSSSDLKRNYFTHAFHII